MAAAEDPLQYICRYLPARASTADDGRSNRMAAQA
jgi:hypothetical protein